MNTQIFEMDYNTGKMVPMKEVELQVGQIIFLSGYGQSKYDHERKAIYEKVTSTYNNGIVYMWVNLDKPQRGRENAYEIKPIEKEFGIGTYYIEGDFATPEEIEVALQKAIEKEKENAVRQAVLTAEREELQEIGKKWFEENRPEGCEYHLIANLEENISDAMTDYFGSKTKKQLFLGFSSHKRDIFSEMRKFAALHPETAFLAEPNEEYEHREKYSMGHGYYLGVDRYSGWQVSKGSSKWGADDLYITIGRQIKANEMPLTPAKPERSERPEAETSGELTSGDITILQYSERSIAVIGNTYPVKEKIKSLGATFNKFLTHPETKQRVCGWVLSITKEAELRQTLSI